MKTGRCGEPVKRAAAPYVLYLKIGIVLAFVCLIHAAVLVDMARDWWAEPALSQGMLIPPLAVYLAWIGRRFTLDHQAVADNRGLLLAAFACLMLIGGKLASEFFMMRISFVVLIAAFIWTFWGIERLRTLQFPLLLLATMVPLPAIVYNSAAAPLQLFASDLATQLAQLAGVTVYRDGNVIHLAQTSLGVVEACSGLNSLSALLVASLLLGYLFCSSLVGRLLLVALALPLSIAVNIFRITGTAVIADYNQAFAEGFYHSFSGWLVFVVGFGALYGIAAAAHRVLDPKP